MKVVIIADSKSFQGSEEARDYVKASYELFSLLDSEIFVQCPEESFELLSKYVPSDHMWIEPVSKGTAAAIGLASVNVMSQFPNELVVYAFANQYVSYQDRLLSTVRAAADIYKQIKKMMFIGVAITAPTSSYGYIEIGRAVKEISGVVAFEMKSFQRYPGDKKIHEYSNAWNYLWDTGYLLCSPENLLELYKKVNPEMYEGFKTISASLSTKFEREVLKTVYEGFPKVSFAVGIGERVEPKSVVVVPVDVGVGINNEH